jgi:hypothetical protein
LGHADAAIDLGRTCDPQRSVAGGHCADRGSQRRALHRQDANHARDQHRGCGQFSPKFGDDSVRDAWHRRSDAAEWSAHCRAGYIPVTFQARPRVTPCVYTLHMARGWACFWPFRSVSGTAFPLPSSVQLEKSCGSRSSVWRADRIQ